MEMEAVFSSETLVFTINPYFVTTNNANIVIFTAVRISCGCCDTFLKEVMKPLNILARVAASVQNTV
jgi:hypothetical protein